MTTGRTGIAEQPASGADPAADPAATGDAAGRPTPLRLARLHLRMGSLGLARAELEALAGRGGLDEAALLDLAEARWRTGDLGGAGEAANVLLDRGAEAPLALIIAAEAVASLGRPGEARRLAGRALEAIDGPLDPWFAGMPRSMIWPGDAVAPSETPEATHAPAAVRDGPRGRRTREIPADSGAAEAFAGGRAALAAGDTPHAALGFGVALRLDPGFARGVLQAIGEEPDEPVLALVAGDALRLLGREGDALAAFARVRGATLRVPQPGEGAGAGAPAADRPSTDAEPR